LLASLGIRLPPPLRQGEGSSADHEKSGLGDCPRQLPSPDDLD
jgi:hypothetical protein